MRRLRIVKNESNAFEFPFYNGEATINGYSVGLTLHHIISKDNLLAQVFKITGKNDLKASLANGVTRFGSFLKSNLSIKNIGNVNDIVNYINTKITFDFIGNDLYIISSDTDESIELTDFTGILYWLPGNLVLGPRCQNTDGYRLTSDDPGSNNERISFKNNNNLLKNTFCKKTPWGTSSDCVANTPMLNNIWYLSSKRNFLNQNYELQN